jgi:hypothetical protein
MNPQATATFSCGEREHLRKHLSDLPKWHQGGEMRLKLIQLRGRSAVQRPSVASLDVTWPKGVATA